MREMSLPQKTEHIELNRATEAVFRTFQVLKDVGMFVRGEMFADASGDVSVGFTNIRGTTACT